MNSVILSTAARALMPVILVLSALLFWRGHNDPGGGFVGGLLAATAFILYAKAEGVPSARRRLKVDPTLLAAFGLGCALLAGLWGALAKGAFLKAVWPFIVVAADGGKSGLPFGSIMLFDFGVYLVVLGTVAAIFFTLEDVVASEADPGS